MGRWMAERADGGGDGSVGTHAEGNGTRLDASGCGRCHRRWHQWCAAVGRATPRQVRGHWITKNNLLEHTIPPCGKDIIYDVRYVLVHLHTEWGTFEQEHRRPDSMVGLTFCVLTCGTTRVQTDRTQHSTITTRVQRTGRDRWASHPLPAPTKTPPYPAPPQRHHDPAAARETNSITHQHRQRSPANEAYKVPEPPPRPRHQGTPRRTAWPRPPQPRPPARRLGGAAAPHPSALAPAHVPRAPRRPPHGPPRLPSRPPRRATPRRDRGGAENGRGVTRVTGAVVKPPTRSWRAPPRAGGVVLLERTPTTLLHSSAPLPPAPADPSPMREAICFDPSPTCTTTLTQRPQWRAIHQ